ncbi:hypothetical protein C8R43DRAFT_1014563 [Mycena crocata]|nr:hypothetical protein C8R43DRAFT_1014563 [Mycena crocata]
MLSSFFLLGFSCSFGSFIFIATTYPCVRVREPGTTHLARLTRTPPFGSTRTLTPLHIWPYLVFQLAPFGSFQP